jgi:hypothetical protein
VQDVPPADAAQFWQLAANIATVGGIVVALLVFIADRIAVSRSRERETYQTLHAEYLRFLELSLTHPELRLSEDLLECPDDTPQWAARRLLCFEVLVSVFESAYFFYKSGHSSKFVERQWSGWESYIVGWLQRDDFRKAWREELNAEFDADFLAHVAGLLAKLPPAHTRPPSPP